MHILKEPFFFFTNNTAGVPRSDGMKTWSNENPFVLEFLELSRQLLHFRRCQTIGRLYYGSSRYKGQTCKWRLVVADYFAPGYFVWVVLTAKLARVMYEEKNMYMAAYDWRLALQNTEIGRRPDIEPDKEEYRTDGCYEWWQKTVIIPHSMGVVYFLYFMKWVEAPAHIGGGGGPDWCRKHIKAAMNIGGPFLGVPKAVDGLFSAEAKDIATGRLWEETMMKPDHQEPNALDNTKPWRRLGLYHAEELDEEGFDVYFHGGFAHVSMRHFNAQEYWLSISREENLSLSRSHASSIKNPVLRVLHKMITYGLCQRITGIWIRYTEQRVLIDWRLVRMIPEDPQSDVPRVSILRAQRASMHDLYERMGSMEIRQGAIERMAYRKSELTTHLVMLSRSMISIISSTHRSNNSNSKTMSSVEMTLVSFVTACSGSLFVCFEEEDGIILLPSSRSRVHPDLVSASFCTKIWEIAKVERKSFALKDKKESSDEDVRLPGSEDEEYAWRYGLQEIPLRKEVLRAIIAVKSDEKVKDENNVCCSRHQSRYALSDLEPNEWIKDSGYSKHMTGNRTLFSNYKAYNGGNVIFGSNLCGNIIGKVKGQYCDPKCKVAYLLNNDSEITKNGNVIVLEEELQTALAISLPKRIRKRRRKACQQALWMKQALIDYDVTMPRKSSKDYKNTRDYIPIISHQFRTPIREKLRNLEQRCIHEGRVVFDNFTDLNYVRSLFEFIEFECLLEINEQVCPRFILEFYSQYQLSYSDEGEMFVEFVIQNQLFSYSLKNFAQILGVPCEGACVFSDRWRVDELIYGIPTDGPYQTNLPPRLEESSYLSVSGIVMDKSVRIRHVVRD
ncbi:DNA helicase PIF1-like protein [Tanacetum coccineum]